MLSCHFRPDGHDRRLPSTQNPSTNQGVGRCQRSPFRIPAALPSARRDRPAATGRLLAPYHFALLRGWVQGIALAELAERYIGPRTDLRVARSTLRWLRSELLALAGRSPRPELAALLRRAPRGDDDSPGTASAAATSTPTLDDFARQFPDGFYSEAELIELFQAAHRPDPAMQRAGARRARLIGRQLDALRYLEPLLAQPPGLQDRLTAWFPPMVAERCARGGLHTLLDLRIRFENRGARWWVTVPRLGAVGAQRIEFWWSQHTSSLGVLAALRRAPLEVSGVYPTSVQPPPLRNYAATGDPPVAPTLPSPAPRLIDATAAMVVSPIEYLRIPAAVDGSQGRNRQRHSRCAIAADDDLAAIAVWLSRRPEGSATWRSYRTEAERFLLWAIVDRGCAMSDLTTEDCIAYQAFLHDPLPAARWINPRPAPRWSPHWRPFAGRLSKSSAGHAQAVLRSMCEFLMRQRYLDTNPWDGVARPGSTRDKIGVGRSFTLAQWALIEQSLDDLADSPGHQRLRFLVRFLYATGMRRGEIADLRLAQFNFDQGVGAWIVTPIGKGGKSRDIPLTSETVALVEHYVRATHPLADVPIDSSLHGLLERLPAQTPLLRGLDFGREETQTLDPSSLYRPLKSFFTALAEFGDLGSPRERARFAQASTHWLRHTFASHAVADEAPLDVVRDVLGHASIATTSVYLSSEMRRRAEALEAVAARRRSRSSH